MKFSFEKLDHYDQMDISSRQFWSAEMISFKEAFLRMRKNTSGTVTVIK